MGKRIINRRFLSELASKILVYSGVSRIFEYNGRRSKNIGVRVINYHDIPKQGCEKFAQQLDYILSSHDAINPLEFRDILIGKLKLDSRPAVVLTFDDGFISHASYVSDMLRDRGVVGWFFVPTAAPCIAKIDQRDWAVQHHVLREEELSSFGERIFASWDEWRSAGQHHVVASHTHDHLRLGEQISAESARFQINKSYEVLNSRLGVTDRIFCWVGGESNSYCDHAASEVANAGTELAFTTCSKISKDGINPLRIERTNVEWNFSQARVRIALSGIIDLRYMWKRRSLDMVFNVKSV